MTKTNQGRFPEGMSTPSLRALEAAGIRSVRDLARWTEADLSTLHGVGPKVLGVLRAAMSAERIHFVADASARQPKQRGGS